MKGKPALDNCLSCYRSMSNEDGIVWVHVLPCAVSNPCPQGAEAGGFLVLSLIMSGKKIKRETTTTTTKKQYRRKVDIT